MMVGGKTSWKAIEVRGPGQSCHELYAAERLAALYRFQIGETGRAGGDPQTPGRAGGDPQTPGRAGGDPQTPGAPHGFSYFVKGRRDARVTNPAQVDWDRFPVLAALEAVTTDELRRLRQLLVEGDDDPTAPPYSGVQEKVPAPVETDAERLGRVASSHEG